MISVIFQMFDIDIKIIDIDIDIKIIDIKLKEVITDSIVVF